MTSLNSKERVAIILSENLQTHDGFFSVDNFDRQKISLKYNVKPIPYKLLENFEKTVNDSKLMFFYTTSKKNLEDSYVAKVFYVDDLDNQNYVIEHWNYYPGRKELTLTHITKHKRDFKLIDSGTVDLINKLNDSIYETFKSLDRLLTK